jgi:hypothetical protein
VTPIQRLRADLDQAKARVRWQEKADRDNVVALEMYRADVTRAERAIREWQEAPELDTLRGIVRGERREAV